VPCAGVADDAARVTNQVWWFAARASGVVAWVLATASVLWGLALSTRAFGRRLRGPWLLDLHRFLGALTVVFVGVHLAGLLLDDYVQFDLVDLAVPLASSWKPVAVGWGVVALYLLLAVELTSLARRWLPRRVWHTVHLGSYGLYLFATVHLWMAGTDHDNLLMRVAVATSAGLVVFFTVFRWVGRADDYRASPSTITSTRSS